MLGRLATVAGAAALASGSACAMSATETSATGCHVVGGELLPAASGGADALCKAIASASAKQAPGVGYSVEVRVFPNSRLSALVTLADGRKLPEQNFVRMDKPLSSGAFARFAESIALELAKAGQRKN
jgi:ABC-type glycerol-3-phosphate transport system substrate-binding protein